MSIFFIIALLLLMGLADLADKHLRIHLNVLRVGAILYLLFTLIVNSIQMDRWHSEAEHTQRLLVVILIIVLVVLEVRSVLRERERSDYGRTITARVASIEENPVRINDVTSYTFTCITEGGVTYSTKTTRKFPPDVIGKSVKVCVAIANGDNYVIDLDSVGEDESREEARRQYAEEEPQGQTAEEKTIPLPPKASELSWRWDDNSKP